MRTKNETASALGRNGTLSREDYFSPAPMLVADKGGVVRDVNLAFETLVGPSAVACRDRPVDELLFGLRDTIDGTFIPPEVPVGSALDPKSNGASCTPTRDSLQRVTLRSDEFGPISFVGTAIWQCDPLTGNRTGSICYWQLLDASGFCAFRAEYLRRLAHQLIWEMYAISYDRILTEMVYYQNVLRRHRRALAEPQIQRIADCAAGTGNLTELLLRQGKEVIAIDIGRAMLSRLRSKPWASSPRLTICQQNAESLRNLADGSVDGVSILLALYDMQNPRNALGEVIRILRPGGRLVITEPKRSMNLQVILDRCVVRLRRIGKYETLSEDMARVDEANKLLDPNRRRNQASLTVEDVWETLQNHGFVDLGMRDSHYGQCATVVGTKPVQ